MQCRSTLYLVLAVAAQCCLAGCARENVWTFRRDNEYQDNIQELVEDKIDSQSAARSGSERWDEYKSDEFQGDDESVVDNERLRVERKRREAADRLLKAGPVVLIDCLIHSLEFNDEVQAGRAAIRSMGGEEIIAKSRFLPRLTYDLTASVVENVGRNVSMGGRAATTLLEFGKDNPIDVVLRERQRQALFSYERTTANVLSEVRRRFFTILLRERQLAERKKLRDEFAARYDRMRKLEAARRVLEVDVLTAKLNVLNEESRINALEKEVLRQKMDLLKAIGLPVEMTDFDLTGEPEKLESPLKRCVEVAFRRSTRIAQVRAAVFEQDRTVRQIIWEYFPDLRIQGGYRGNFGDVGVDLVTDDNLYSGGAFGERIVEDWNDESFANGATLFGADRAGWRTGIDLTLPVFKGLERQGRFRRERALLDQVRHLLNDAISDTELLVAKSYQTFLEEARETDILAETVHISKERLRVQERLKELGRITDNELETFRERFFSDQDGFFEQQIRLIEAQERLRLAMRYFEPGLAEEE